MNTQNKHEAVPGNPLDKAFSQYVSDAYKKGEFNLPEVELVGETKDHVDSEGDIGFTVVRRKLGSTAVNEILSKYGDNISLDGEDGSLTLHDTPHGALIIEGKDAKVARGDGRLDTVPSDATVSLGTLFETPIIKHAEEAPEDTDDK